MTDAAASRVSRRWLLAALVLAVAFVTAVTVWAVLDALRARGKLDSARATVVRLEGTGRLDATDAKADLDVASAQAREATQILASPASRLVAALPLVGRSWVAERTVAQASVVVLRATRTLVDDASGIGSGDRVDLTRLARMHDDLIVTGRSIAEPLRRLSALDTGWTPPQVGRGVREARDKLLPVGSIVARAAAATTALVDIFGGNGPRTLLICLENNAELRGTGGLITTFAVARSNGGRLTVEPFTDVQSVADRPGSTRTVPAPPDYVRAYGRYLANTTLWKNVNYSPSVPDSAQVLARLAAVSAHVKPDAIVLLDVPAIAALVESEGVSVRLPDGHVADGTELEHDLLVESYGAATADPALQRARRLNLEKAAGRVLQETLSTPPTLEVARALAQQVDGRHVVLWSQRSDVEQQLVQAQAAGDAAPGAGDIAMVSANNLGDPPRQGNKLDYYVSRSLSVRVAVGRDRATVEQTLTVRNNAPAGLVPYVAGTHHPGRISELWGFAMGAGAQVIGVTVDGKPASGEVQPLDGGEQLLTFADTPRGATTTIVVQYVVPVQDGRYRLRLVPQPLASPATVSVRIRGSGSARVGTPVAVTRMFDSEFTVSAHAS